MCTTSSDSRTVVRCFAPQKAKVLMLLLNTELKKYMCNIGIDIMCVLMSKTAEGLRGHTTGYNQHDV